MKTYARLILRICLGLLAALVSVATPAADAPFVLAAADTIDPTSLEFPE